MAARKGRSRGRRPLAPSHLEFSPIVCAIPTRIANRLRAIGAQSDTGSLLQAGAREAAARRRRVAARWTGGVSGRGLSRAHAHPGLNLPILDRVGSSLVFVLLGRRLAAAPHRGARDAHPGGSPPRTCSASHAAPSMLESCSWEPRQCSPCDRLGALQGRSRSGGTKPSANGPRNIRNRA
jgi:hypothetical protein